MNTRCVGTSEKRNLTTPRISLVDRLKGGGKTFGYSFISFPFSLQKEPWFDFVMKRQVRVREYLHMSVGVMRD
jgi:hypothetical protein